MPRRIFIYILLLAMGEQSCRSHKVVAKNNDQRDLIAPSKTATSNTAKLSADSSARTSIAFYIPKATDPEKILRINFNIFQDDSGNGNFSNIPIDLQRLNTIFGWLNGFYAHNPPPSDPITGVIDLPKTHIQFELNGIFFYKNSSIFKSINSGELLREIKTADPKRMEQLNICFTKGKFGSAAGLSSMSNGNLNDDMYVILLNFYNGGNVLGDYAGATNLAHELGHVFDLSHTYEGGGASAYCGKGADDPEYLDDIFGPWPGNCPHFITEPEHPWSFDTFASPTDKRTNNIMGGFQSSSYFSPKQIGIMHRTLMLKTPKRYLK